MKRYLSLFCLFFCSALALAQTTVQVLDSKTQEPIPYANVLINEKEGSISNEDGIFTLSEQQTANNATILITYIGYQPQQVTVDQIRARQNKIHMTEAPFELEDVKVKKMDPKEIIALVNSNLKENYTAKSAKESRIFYRNLGTFKPQVMDFEITKSTGFDKKALAEFNQEIGKMVGQYRNKNVTSYSDVLLDYFSASKGSKAQVLKATRFSEYGGEDDLDVLQKKFTDMVLKHLDTTKFYRVKSGIIGSKDTISLSKSYNDKKNKSKKQKETDPLSNLNSLKKSLRSDLGNLNPLNTSKLFQFLQDPNAYDFTLDGVMVNGMNDFVYVVSFKPRKGRAYYEGKAYISDTDYGIVRLDYKLANGKKLEGINLKLLLGIKFSENQGSGTVIYRKDADGTAYQTHYASITKGMYFYFNRPFKFIELTKSDRDVFAMDVKVEGVSSNRYELLRINQKSFTEGEYEAFVEKEFKYSDIKKYDPSLWKDYGIIEPVEEMKRLNITDRMEQ